MVRRALESLATLNAECRGTDAADLGAGFGYLSAELLERCPRIRSLDLYEAESRALELARDNLSAATVPVGYHWHDVTTGLPRKYDVIVTNPPFHTSTHHDRPDIGRRFIAVAAQSLKPGGRLWLVANRHLPYESVLDARFGSVRSRSLTIERNRVPSPPARMSACMQVLLTWCFRWQEAIRPAGPLPQS